jgi:hypothetical protein
MHENTVETQHIQGMRIAFLVFYDYRMNANTHTAKIQACFELKSMTPVLSSCFPYYEID